MALNYSFVNSMWKVVKHAIDLKTDLAKDVKAAKKKYGQVKKATKTEEIEEKKEIGAKIGRSPIINDVDPMKT